MIAPRQLAVVLTLATLCVACSPRSDSNARYSVVVVAFDAQWKIRGIKAIREETGLGLADAKQLIEWQEAALIALPMLLLVILQWSSAINTAATTKITT